MSEQLKKDSDLTHIPSECYYIKPFPIFYFLGSIYTLLILITLGVLCVNKKYPENSIEIFIGMQRGIKQICIL